MKIYEQIAQELQIQKQQVVNTVELIDTDNSIPFIARYRKEVTGNLDDAQLRYLEERLLYLRNLEARKADILRLIDQQEKLTPELRAQIEAATVLQQVEELYLPFRPKKRTRATIAKEKGLQPLADYLLDQQATSAGITQLAKDLVDPNQEVHTPEDALKFAMDILAEQFSEEIKYRDFVRNNGFNHGKLQSTLSGVDEENVYQIYHQFEQPVKSLKSHQVLAMFRGEKLKILKLKLVVDEEFVLNRLKTWLAKETSTASQEYLELALEDGYKRLLFPSIETQIRNHLKEEADLSSIDVFAGNLKPYLLQPPLKNKVILALDPGFRTGCKIAVIDEYGKFLDYATIFPTKPREDVVGSRKVMTKFIHQYQVQVIAIGNGTASRETQQFVVDLIQDQNLKQISYAIVNEAGASIYSASKIAEKEFPKLDVSIRGAISIGRRLQDPLAELVKIEPKNIGVGQYQHDVNQKQLTEKLQNVVEDSVNSVGVNLNTASTSLLSYVSGISPRVAENIVKHKETNGAFTTRQQLLDVKGLGPKAYQQAAGFLRIPDGTFWLDNTAVHPESYEIAFKLKDKDLNTLDLEAAAQQLQVGELTLKDIIEELKKPGRDLREDLPPVVLRSDVLSISDLKENMVLKGTVRNVVDFGAFVDIGIKNDGLVHISQLADRFVKHPSEIVQVGDVVEVRIINIDKKTEKVGLSMRKVH